MRTVSMRLGQSGGSVVEFAIVAPVLIAMVMFASYFADAWLIRMRNQEAARFATWEFTAFPLSNYTTSDNTKLYKLAQTQIQNDLIDIYSDFDSSDPHAVTDSFVATHKLESAKLEFEDMDTPLASTKSLNSIPGVGGALSSIINVGNAGLDLVGPPAFKFDMKGMIRVKVVSQFTNQLLPASWLGQFRFGQINQWEMDDQVVLVADAWTLHDGRDVNLGQGQNGFSQIENTGKRHPMAQQVDRMKFLGLTDKFMPPELQKGINTINKTLGMAGITLGDPLFDDSTPVAALNYRREGAQSYGCSSGTTAYIPLSGRIDLRANGRDIDVGQRCFQTAPFRTTNAYQDSPEAQVYADSRRYYMGCKQPESQDTTACH